MLQFSEEEQLGSVLIMRNERLIEAAQNQRPGSGDPEGFYKVG